MKDLVVRSERASERFPSAATAISDEGGVEGRVDFDHLTRRRSRPLRVITKWRQRGSTTK